MNWRDERVTRHKQAVAPALRLSLREGKDARLKKWRGGCSRNIFSDIRRPSGTSRRGLGDGVGTA
jgi:hypothetical protein